MYVLRLYTRLLYVLSSTNLVSPFFLFFFLSLISFLLPPPPPSPCPIFPFRLLLHRWSGWEGGGGVEGGGEGGGGVCVIPSRLSSLSYIPPASRSIDLVPVLVRGAVDGERGICPLGGPGLHPGQRDSPAVLTVREVVPKLDKFVYLLEFLHLLHWGSRVTTMG